MLAVSTNKSEDHQQELQEGQILQQKGLLSFFNHIIF